MLDFGNILLNVFFIMFPLIFYKFSLEDSPGRRTMNDVLTFFIFIIPIILCMEFPIHQQGKVGILYDLREIPLISLILYGKLSASFAVYAILTVVRFIIGGTGAYIGLAEQYIFQCDTANSNLSMTNLKNSAKRARNRRSKFITMNWRAITARLDAALFAPMRSRPNRRLPSPNLPSMALRSAAS